MPYSPKASEVPPVATPLVRPRWCLRWATLRGINMQFTSVVTSEVRGLVGVVGPPSDVFFLVEQLLELEVGFLDQRRRPPRCGSSAGRRAALDTTRRGSVA